MKTKPRDHQKTDPFPTLDQLFDSTLSTGLKQLCPPASDARQRAALRWAYVAGFLAGGHINLQAQLLPNGEHDAVMARYLACCSSELQLLKTYHAKP